MKKIKYEVTLSYKEKIYRYIEKIPKELERGYVFNYLENNFSCDCNRSLFIQRYCDKDFPELDCGESIKLVSLINLNDMSLKE